MNPLLLELIIVGSFLAGVGASAVVYAIVRAAWTVREPVMVVKVLRRRPYRVVRRPQRPSFPTSGSFADLGCPARQRFATPLPAIAVSPGEWARRTFDDPRSVRLAVHIGAGAAA